MFFLISVFAQFSKRDCCHACFDKRLNSQLAQTFLLIPFCGGVCEFKLLRIRTLKKQEIYDPYFNMYLNSNPGELYILIRGLWGCAAGWGRIFTAVLTVMGSHFQ